VLLFYHNIYIGFKHQLTMNMVLNTIFLKLSYEQNKKRTVCNKRMLPMMQSSQWMFRSWSIITQYRYLCILMKCLIKNKLGYYRVAWN